MDLVSRGLEILSDPHTTRWLSPLLVLADAGLCGLIIWKVPYTEIDWQAYMTQVEQYISGERDYYNIKGGTGPLVYPAAHVYIYKALYALTDHGVDIVRAQLTFALLYLCTLALVISCYRRAGAPPYVFPLLVLSKRLHSIYLLRLFNDPFAVAGLFAAIYAYQRRRWALGSLLFSLAVGVKMSVLLALPAVAVVLYQGHFVGKFFSRAITHAGIMLGAQVLLGLPFLRHNARAYLSRAFELTRIFLFKWTVNWRFLGEEVFLSPAFSIALLVLHLSLIALFLTTRWIRPSKRSFQEVVHMAFKPPAAEIQRAIRSQVTPQFVLTTILTANIIGMLCARSLHYQFYSWLAWGTPFLLWRTGFHPVIQYALWAAQEWAWNVYPSTNTSSQVLVGVLAVTVAGIWTGTRTADADLQQSRVTRQAQRTHVE